jgi:hypothetical protein
VGRTVVRVLAPDQEVRLLQPIGEYPAGTECWVARSSPGSDVYEVVFEDGRELTVTRIALAAEGEDATGAP